MIDILVKKFVKNHEEIHDLRVRAAYGMLSGGVGIFCNVLLFALKLLVGLGVKSLSVMSDAFNNLADAASSVIGFVGTKLASQPADEEHPFGHGRMEYIVALVVAFIVMEVGLSLLKSSIDKILHPEDIAFSLVSVSILGASILIKLWLAYFNRTLGEKINSSVMKATAADSLGDVLATTATIVSLVIYGVWGINVDGWIGLGVSVVVVLAGINIAKDTLAPLLGEAISPEVYDQITRFVESYDGIMGTHDLLVHNYGPGRSMASIHAEVPNTVDIERSHEIIDQIEKDAMRSLGLFLVIHMDPIAVDDPQVSHYRGVVENVIHSLDDRCSIHDFRMVKGERRTNLIFDLVVPREWPVDQDEKLTQKIGRLVQEQETQCCCVITVERSFVAVTKEISDDK